MRVHLVIGSLGAGGAERQMLRLAAELQALGTQVVIHLLSSCGPLRSEIERLNLRTFEVHPARAKSGPLEALLWIGSVARTIRYLWRERPDVVHAWLFHAYVFALPLAWLTGVPVRISGRRGLRNSLKRGFVVDLLVKASGVFTSAYTANSQAVAEDMRESEDIDPSRIFVIRNGIELPEFVAGDVEAQPPVGVVTANLIHYKGHLDLLQAVALSEAPFRLKLVGAGPMEAALRATIADLGLQDRIELCGYVADPMKVLLTCQFAVLASHSEGLPNAVIEAMACGLPVIATDVGGVRELLDEHGGVIVPPHNSKALAAALDRVSGDPEFRASAGEHNRQLAAAFDWGAVAHRYLDLYANLVEERTGGRR